MAEKRVKKNKEEKKITEVSKYAGILIRPRVTEKATFLQSEGNVYVFEVSERATSKEVAKAVKDIHKVAPRRVNMVKNPAKKIMMRGKRGFTGGVKKAYVFLKAGDKIE